MATTHTWSKTTSKQTKTAQMAAERTILINFSLPLLWLERHVPFYIRPSAYGDRGFLTFVISRLNTNNWAFDRSSPINFLGLCTPATHSALVPEQKRSKGFCLLSACTQAVEPIQEKFGRLPIALKPTHFEESCETSKGDALHFRVSNKTCALEADVTFSQDFPCHLPPDSIFNFPGQPYSIFHDLEYAFIPTKNGYEQHPLQSEHQKTSKAGWFLQHLHVESFNTDGWTLNGDPIKDLIKPEPSYWVE